MRHPPQRFMVYGFPNATRCQGEALGSDWIMMAFPSSMDYPMGWLKSV